MPASRKFNTVRGRSCSNLLERRFWIVSGLSPIRKKPNEIRVANHSASFSTYRGPFGSYPVVLTTQYRSREEISGFASLAPPIQNMWLSTLHIQSQGAIRDYAAMANLFAFSSHLGVFKPITRSHRNTDPSTRKAQAIT
jgi:hypothetical protein